MGQQQELHYFALGGEPNNFTEDRQMLSMSVKFFCGKMTFLKLFWRRKIIQPFPCANLGQVKAAVLNGGGKKILFFEML